MTNPSGDRLDRIESLLESLIAASAADRGASNERLTRIENLVEINHRESNELMTCFEAGLERLEQGLEETRQLVHSNNRFLESFSADLRRYIDSMNKRPGA
jgi:hypothetical protein